MTKNISLGNDISRWQGDVNFDTFKNNSQFVIIKSSEGNGFTDPKFTRNQAESRRVGLPLGYYHFARPDLGNTPEVEADYFLKIIGSPVEGEVYVLDYEPASNPGDVVAWCKAFLDRVLEKTGTKPLIYLNQSQVKSFNWQPVIDAGFGLWIAAYTFDPNKNDVEIGKWPFAAIQQWTNKQSVPGISGNVDGNVFFGTIETFKKYGYKKPIVTPPETPPGDSEEVKQLKATIASLTTDLDNANISIKSKDTRIGELEENIKQKDETIKQSTEKTKQFVESVKKTITLFNQLGGEE
jgi:GH25 family lysozyme M1 (1,4-beta-N-acetylmuramidase)